MWQVAVNEENDGYTGYFPPKIWMNENSKQEKLLKIQEIKNLKIDTVHDTV